MGLLSKKIRREQLNPGDHIYTWRLGYSYSHHGIYVGDGKVVHLTRAPGLIIFSSSESSPSRPSGEDRVECCSIEEFLCGGDLYLFEYGVMTALFFIKRGGTCTPFTSDPPKDVLHRASILLDKGFGDYDLLKNNCEDLAIYCKTSLLRAEGPKRGISEQSQFLFAIITVVIFSPVGSLPSALALVIHGVLYCSLRLMYYKEEVKKVAVENLDDLSHRRTTRMENSRTSRISLSAGYYIVYTILTFNLWSWTPSSRILLWIRFVLLFSALQGVVSDHLRARRINLQVLGEHVAGIIWVLGCWYWRSESRLYFWTKLYCLHQVLLIFVSDQQRKLYSYILVLVFWHWAPTNRILLWIRCCLLFIGLEGVLAANGINLKVGGHVAWIIWVIGCWYWRSESILFLLTKLYYLYDVLMIYVTNQHLKLHMDITATIVVLGFWFWTPESTILLWIRLVFLHYFLWYFVSNQLFNNCFKFGRFFFAYFVIQSVVLFMGLDYKDYFFRITKSIFL